MPHNDKLKNESLKAIDDAPVRAGQRWQHNETKSIYTILAVGLDEETLEPVVNYAGHDGIPWFRKLSVFLGAKNGAPRFTMQENRHAQNGWRPTDGFEERPS